MSRSIDLNKVTINMDSSVFYKIDNVRNIRRIYLDSDLKSSLLNNHTTDYVKKIEDRLKSYNCYRFDYLSGDHWVESFSIEPQSEEILPCIIYNRGGNNDFGYTTDKVVLTSLLRMASWGYYVFGSMYSGGSHSEGTDEFGGKDVLDVSNLYKLVSEIPTVNVEKTGLYGSSRGGMMTLLLLKNKLIPAKSVVLRGAATDLVRQCKLRPKMKSNVFKKCFGAAEVELEKRSAVYWVNMLPKDIPILVMHGLADWRVSPLDALDLSKEMYKFKVPHRLIMFEGNDHRLSENFTEAYNLTREWFERYLKKENSLPNVEHHGK